MTRRGAQRSLVCVVLGGMLAAASSANGAETCETSSANYITSVVNQAKVCLTRLVPAGRTCENKNRQPDRKAQKVTELCPGGAAAVPPLTCAARQALLTAGLAYGSLAGNGFTHVCVLSTCGNALTEPPAEQCDDGNMTAGDGCSPSCQLESAQCLDLCAGVLSVPGTTVKAELFASGLDNPLLVTAAPRDVSRVFIVEQPGTIRIVKFGQLLGTPFLDVSSLVSGGFEQGLLGLAFDPDYANNGRFYVNYTDLSGDTVISRFQVSANPDIASPTETMLLTFTQPFANHNGGHLAFGPDGYLYIASGDGGSGGDPMNNGQSINTLLGKLLRIDVSGALYTSPSSNPFFGATPGLDEIWAYGLRNPWRFSFDRSNGDLYIGDVGQGSWEEIDYQLAASAGGENYGWRIVEGNGHCFNPPMGCVQTGLTLPIHEFSHGVGPVCGGSVTAGHVYRGCKMPDLHGTYFYGDYCLEFIRTFKVMGGVATNHQDVTAQLESGGVDINSITSLGEDARGELYICDQAGDVFKVVPGP